MFSSKAYRGPRLRRLREERGLTQLAVSKALGLSASYYNQLENDQRPLTPSLQLRVGAAFAVDMQFFADDDEGLLFAGLHQALHASLPASAVSASELREFAHNHPVLANALVQLHARAGDVSPVSAHEEVRDFFYARHNYIGQLDELAERTARDLGLTPGQCVQPLIECLQRRHGVQTRTEPELGQAKRCYDPESRSLRLSSQLTASQRAFQLATQLGQLEARDSIQELSQQAGFTSAEARALARAALAQHFAGALLMPYAEALESAERWHYDIDRLRRHFQVSYETTCHRLSTLQRPGREGVPFCLMRVDRAGNVSKRQSATDFPFARAGGNCPLWNVYEAFAQPGRILRQLAQLPDGRTYLWIARTVTRSHGAFGTPDTLFSLGLGCELKHAPRVIYAQGLDLERPAAAAAIGMACKVCERRGCAQRACPPAASQATQHSVR